MHTPTYTHTHIDITLERIHVANLPGNTINALIKIGTYGPPGTCMSMPMSMPMPMFMPIHMRVGSVLTDRRGITIIHMPICVPMRMPMCMPMPMPIPLDDSHADTHAHVHAHLRAHAHAHAHAHPSR